MKVSDFDQEKNAPVVTARGSHDPSMTVRQRGKGGIGAYQKKTSLSCFVVL